MKGEIKMTFQYVKTVEIDFSTIITISDVADFIVDSLCDNLDSEIWDDDEQAKLFETITKEAYRYVAKELNKMVE